MASRQRPSALSSDSAGVLRCGCGESPFRVLAAGSTGRPGVASSGATSADGDGDARGDGGLLAATSVLPIEVATAEMPLLQTVKDERVAWEAVNFLRETDDAGRLCVELFRGSRIFGPHWRRPLRCCRTVRIGHRRNQRAAMHSASGIADRIHNRTVRIKQMDSIAVVSKQVRFPGYCNT